MSWAEALAFNLVTSCSWSADVEGVVRGREEKERERERMREGRYIEQNKTMLTENVKHPLFFPKLVYQISFCRSILLPPQLQRLYTSVLCFLSLLSFHNPLLASSRLCCTFPEFERKRVSRHVHRKEHRVPVFDGNEAQIVKAS